MENSGIFELLVLLFHYEEKANPNIHTFLFGEIQTATYYAQKALNKM